MMKRFNILYVVCILLLVACQKDPEVLLPVSNNPVDSTDTTTVYRPTPYYVELPLGFPEMPIPADNPLTVEGVALGRKLFYDKLLSQNQTQSCGSCHGQTFGFTDANKQFSIGVTGQIGERNSMPIFNLAWVEKFAKTNHKFFWDGGATSLENQVLGPITNPIEMNETLKNVLQKLQSHPQYPGLFKKAFGTDSITTRLLMFAIAQFERTIVSGNTRFDYFRMFGDQTMLTPQEKRGFDLFMAEEKADCFHCHNPNSIFSTDFLFHHNGHQSSDKGLGRITGNTEDNGKFRTPSLRNLVFTAPYMHDGRFSTLEEVVEFYNSGAIRVYPADPFITKHPNGLGLTTEEKQDLVAFLKTMTDSTLLTNPNYKP
jgi:cytochrome c peroxidase